TKGNASITRYFPPIFSPVSLMTISSFTPQNPPGIAFRCFLYPPLFFCVGNLLRLFPFYHERHSSTSPLTRFPQGKEAFGGESFREADSQALNPNISLFRRRPRPQSHASKED